jgi:hypothetical protein
MNKKQLFAMAGILAGTANYHHEITKIFSPNVDPLSEEMALSSRSLPTVNLADPNLQQCIDDAVRVALPNATGGFVPASHRHFLYKLFGDHVTYRQRNITEVKSISVSEEGTIFFRERASSWGVLPTRLWTYGGFVGRTLFKLWPETDLMDYMSAQDKINTSSASPASNWYDAPIRGIRGCLPKRLFALGQGQ